jgi:exosortase/archaeosortase family protein
MSRKSKKRRAQSKKPPSLKESWTAWYESKRPLLGYVLRFSIVMAAFYLLSLTPFYRKAVSGAVLTNAQIAHRLLGFLGEASVIERATLRSNGEAIITVEPGCTGFDFSWFLVAAIAAFPAPILGKVIGIVAGISALLALNIFRVSSLYWIGVHRPEHFAFVHEQLWAVLLNLTTVSLMVAWIVWVKRTDENRSSA